MVNSNHNAITTGFDFSIGILDENTKFYYNTRLITYTMIKLSGFHGHIVKDVQGSLIAWIAMIKPEYPKKV